MKTPHSLLDAAAPPYPLHRHLASRPGQNGPPDGGRDISYFVPPPCSWSRPWPVLACPRCPALPGWPLPAPRGESKTLGLASGTGCRP